MRLRSNIGAGRYQVVYGRPLTPSCRRADRLSGSSVMSETKGGVRPKRHLRATRGCGWSRTWRTLGVAGTVVETSNEQWDRVIR